MRYIAKKEKDKYLVSGIKEMETIDGNKVEVIIDTKEYDKKKLEEVIVAYKQELDNLTETYTNGLNDMNDILEAINQI